MSEFYFCFDFHITSSPQFEESTVSAVQNDSSKLGITANKEKSFQCSKSLDIVLNGKESVTVTINKIKVQPFGESFGEGKKIDIRCLEVN